MTIIYVHATDRKPLDRCQHTEDFQHYMTEVLRYCAIHYVLRGNAAEGFTFDITSQTGERQRIVDALATKASKL